MLLSNRQEEKYSQQRKEVMQLCRANKEQLLKKKTITEARGELSQKRY